MTRQLSLPNLARTVAGGPRALFATVGGAHQYGFASKDSDVDLRGAFVQSLAERCRLTPPAETISVNRLDGAQDLDWVAHDVRKFARLMARRNGHVLEQLYSPLEVTGGDWLSELRAIGEGCVVRHLYHHYRGFAATKRAMLRKRDATVKDLLYLYRVYLTGLHVLRSGQVEANLATLLGGHRLPGVDELIERKREGTEDAALEDGEWEAHQPAADRLDHELQSAFEHSRLPDEPTGVPALDDYVVRACLELGR